MFIRSSTAINDCLINLDIIGTITKYMDLVIEIYYKDKGKQSWGYESKEDRDKAYDELCKFLNNNYKLRDFT
jgi:hypothetical protein